MSAPTNEEKQLLNVFRKRVDDILETCKQHNDSFLLRWLRARNLDIDQAECMLRTSIAWRKENAIDFILETQLDPLFKTEYPYYINGVDNKGQPVVVIPVGKWDLRRCVALGKTEESKQFIKYIFEDICRAINNKNRTRDPEFHHITQFTAILDWKGFSYMQLCNLKAVQNMLYTGTTFEGYYPEILSCCLFVNCPSFLNIFLMMLNPILATKTLGKISVYGSNRNEWEEVCREIIDDDQLQGILKFVS